MLGGACATRNPSGSNKATRPAPSWRVVPEPDAYLSRSSSTLEKCKQVDVDLVRICRAHLMSKRYKISREAQDEYSFKSQQRTFAAQEAGRFNDEIIATTVTKRFDN